MLLALALSAAWPDLASPTPIAGPNDAALIVAIDRYATAPAVAGAVDNANAWYAHFAKTLSPARIALLRDHEATLEKIRKYALATSASGTVWFVFIGHGAPARDGKDGLLVGYDAQQDIDSVESRSIRLNELLALLAAGKQARTVAVIDACFSGFTKGLQPLVVVSRSPLDKAVVMTAAHADQYAGALPGEARPAFSYLTLGALRGWADANHDSQVSVEEAIAYTTDALKAVLKDRTQTPDLSGTSKLPLVIGVSEKGPDLAALVLKSEVGFAPMPAAPAPIRIGSPMGTINMQVEQALDDALTAQEDRLSSGQSKANAWCRLAQISAGNPHLAQARDGCVAWSKYAGEQARLLQSLDDDYKTLSGYLRLKHKTREQKLAAVDAFLTSYGGLSPHVRVDSVRHLRPLVANGQFADLPTETHLRMIFHNDLDDAGTLHTAYLQVDATLVATLAYPGAHQAEPVFDNVVAPGAHDFRADMALALFGTLGVRMYCGDSLSLSDLGTTAAILRLRNVDGNASPRLFLKLGAAPEREVLCRTETTGRGRSR